MNTIYVSHAVIIPDKTFVVFVFTLIPTHYFGFWFSFYRLLCSLWACDANHPMLNPVKLMFSIVSSICPAKSLITVLRSHMQAMTFKKLFTVILVIRFILLCLNLCTSQKLHHTSESAHNIHTYWHLGSTIIDHQTLIPVRSAHRLRL